MHHSITADVSQCTLLAHPPCTPPWIHTLLQPPCTCPAPNVVCCHSTILYAGFDPLFWLHHCQLDRALWLFQNNNGQWNGQGK